VKRLLLSKHWQISQPSFVIYSTIHPAIKLRLAYLGDHWLGWVGSRGNPQAPSNRQRSPRFPGKDPFRFTNLQVESFPVVLEILLRKDNLGVAKEEVASGIDSVDQDDHSVGVEEGDSIDFKWAPHTPILLTCADYTPSSIVTIMLHSKCRHVLILCMDFENYLYISESEPYFVFTLLMN
jgi:hypothetical protein